MLAVVFILCLVRVASAFELTCSEINEASATMFPAKDNIIGRYTTRVCVEMKPNVTKWGLDLTFKPEQYCRSKHHRFKPGPTHSSLTEDVADRLKDLNCSYVCMENQWDLIFNSCYMLKSVLHQRTSEFPPTDWNFTISNPYDLQYFNVTPEVSIITHENHNAVSFLGRVPPTVYSVELVNLNKSSPPVVVTDNCTVAADLIRLECVVRTEVGCYRLWLNHGAAWVNGVMEKLARVHTGWCRQPPPAPRLAGEARGWAVVWWSAGAALALAAAALLWRARDHRHLHKRVLRYWTHHSASTPDERADEAVEAGAEGRAEDSRVLLLYARECERGQRLVALLRELLLQHYGVQAVDLFSAESVRLAGAAPHAWVRGALARRRVLVLQTPALLALHAPQQQLLANAHTCAPLLAGAGAGGAGGAGAGAAPAGRVYRAPHFGDALLQYALRLLSDDACQPLAYRKYYLATLSELPTEVFPLVVPFRRYPLPEAADVLARDLRADGPVAAAAEQPAERQAERQAALRRLEQAAHEFVAFVRDCPDYLDELLIT